MKLKRCNENADRKTPTPWRSPSWPTLRKLRSKGNLLNVQQSAEFGNLPNVVSQASGHRRSDSHTPRLYPEFRLPIELKTLAALPAPNAPCAAESCGCGYVRSRPGRLVLDGPACAGQVARNREHRRNVENFSFFASNHNALLAPQCCFFFRRFFRRVGAPMMADRDRPLSPMGQIILGIDGVSGGVFAGDVAK